MTNSKGDASRTTQLSQRLQAFHEDADDVALVRGEYELIVWDFDQGTPLARFDVFEVMEQVDGLADAAGAAEEDMADGFARG